MSQEPNSYDSPTYSAIIKQLRRDGLLEIARQLERQVNENATNDGDMTMITGQKRKFAEMDDSMVNETENENDNDNGNENENEKDTINLMEAIYVYKKRRERKIKQFENMRQRLLAEENAKINNNNNNNGKNNEENNSNNASNKRKGSDFDKFGFMTVEQLLSSSESESDDEDEYVGNKNNLNSNSKENSQDSDSDVENNENKQGNESKMEIKRKSRNKFGDYQLIYESKHKTNVNCIKFNRDCSFAASVSMDGTIKLYSLQKLFLKSQSQKGFKSSFSKVNPVIRQFYAQNEQWNVNEIDFDASMGNKLGYLACCDDGGRISFFNLSKSQTSASTVIEENFSVASISYHASGEYLLAGGSGSYVRLYDIRKQQGYIGKKSSSDDCDITRVKYGKNGQFFVTCDKKGDIQLYDGRIMKCVSKLSKCHNGASIDSIDISNDEHYLLSCGLDNVVRSWDVRNGQAAEQYDGINQTNIIACQARFSWDNQHILASSYHGHPYFTSRIFIYDRKSRLRIGKFREHKHPIKWIDTSSTRSSFASCDINGKVKFFDKIHIVNDANDNEAINGQYMGTTNLAMTGMPNTMDNTTHFGIFN